MTERWTHKDFPHKGYAYQGCEDSGSYDSVCEVCGNAVRYIHRVAHPTGVNLRVGGICAGMLTDNYEVSRANERKIKPPTTIQIINWVGTGWRAARLGGYYKRMQKMVVILKRYSTGYSYLIKELDENRYSINEYKGRNYETMEEAKIAAYYQKKEILANRKNARHSD
jgi:hypothetical protein